MLGFSLPFYRSPTLLLSLGLSVRVLYYLITQRPDVIHVSSPGLLVFAATLYAKLLAIPLVVRRAAAPFLAMACRKLIAFARPSCRAERWSLSGICTGRLVLLLQPSR